LYERYHIFGPHGMCETMRLRFHLTDRHMAR